ncbi:MAG: hypothetical protein ACRC2S_00245 [Waterburya sp.]
MNKIVNLNQEEFEAKINYLSKEIKSKIQTNVIDGIIEEIATNRIYFQEIVQKLDIIDSQLTINTIEVPNYFSERITDEIIISADFPLSAENGFYELEYDERGKTMRWTGLNNSFFFDLCFDRNREKQLTLDILSPLSEKNVTQIKCFIDNLETTVTTTFNQGICQVNTFILPNNNIANTKISFVVPELIKPSEIDSNRKDNRNLGVVFYQLAIKNAEKNNQ